MSSTGLSRTNQYTVGIVSLAGIIGLFLFTRGALVGQLEVAALSTGELFTIAFFAGAWSVLTVILVINHIGHRRWGEAGLKLKPLE